MEVGYYGMPLGFRFHPTDQELVSSYLRDRALSGKPLGNPFVHEFNLFGQTPPWVVWEQFGGNSLLDQDLFFFYELRSRSDSDSRSKRRIEAGGTWSETSSDKVLGLDGIPIGDKGHFRYNNKGSNNNGGWLLEEYSLLSNVVAGPRVVLSRLKRNLRSRSENKMNSSSPTHDFNEKPPIKRARKEVSNEKLLIKRKRARKEPDHEYVPLMSDVPSSPVFLGGEEYPLDGEAVRGDIKEWLTTLEGKLPREWPQIDKFSQPLDGFNYWTDCLWMSDSVNDE
ncbi:hypothetical protein ACFX2I_031782 [Malus domestica]